MLGKEELIYLARLGGKPLGRLMGSFQGMRMRYDLKMQGDDLHRASRNVAKGLRGITSISNDFNMIKYGSSVTHNSNDVGSSSSSSSSSSGSTNTYRYNEMTNDMILEKEKIAKMFHESKRLVEAEEQQQQQQQAPPAPVPIIPPRSGGKFK